MRVAKRRQLAKDIVTWRTQTDDAWYEASRRLPYKLLRNEEWREKHLIKPKVRIEKRRILEEEEGVLTLGQIMAQARKS